MNPKYIIFIDKIERDVSIKECVLSDTVIRVNGRIEVSGSIVCSEKRVPVRIMAKTKSWNPSNGTFSTLSPNIQVNGNIYLTSDESDMLSSLLSSIENRINTEIELYEKIVQR